MLRILLARKDLREEPCVGGKVLNTGGIYREGFAFYKVKVYRKTEIAKPKLLTQNLPIRQNGLCFIALPPTHWASGGYFPFYTIYNIDFKHWSMA